MFQTPDSLATPWPEFLGLLDSSPTLALDGLYRFTWKLMAARPPRIYRSMSREDREDCVVDLVVGLADRDFRRLRTYRDHGRPFASWLCTTATRHAIRWLVGRRATVELPADLAADDPAPDPVLGSLRDEIAECMAKLSPKCRTYLICLADGMRPRDVVQFLRLDMEENRAVSDDTRYCKEKLRSLLASRGITPESVL